MPQINNDEIIQVASCSCSTSKMEIMVQQTKKRLLMLSAGCDRHCGAVTKWAKINVCRITRIIRIDMHKNGGKMPWPTATHTHSHIHKNTIWRRKKYQTIQTEDVNKQQEPKPSSININFSTNINAKYYYSDKLVIYDDVIFWIRLKW